MKIIKKYSPNLRNTPKKHSAIAKTSKNMGIALVCDAHIVENFAVARLCDGNTVARNGIALVCDAISVERNAIALVCDAHIVENIAIALVCDGHIVGNMTIAQVCDGHIVASNGIPTLRFARNRLPNSKIRWCLANLEYHQYKRKLNQDYFLENHQKK